MTADRIAETMSEHEDAPAASPPALDNATRAQQTRERSEKVKADIDAVARLVGEALADMEAADRDVMMAYAAGVLKVLDAEATALELQSRGLRLQSAMLKLRAAMADRLGIDPHPARKDDDEATQ